jgi:hypothetical protein
VSSISSTCNPCNKGFLGGCKMRKSIFALWFYYYYIYEPSDSRRPPLRPKMTVTGESRDWYLIPEQPAPAPHLAHPDGCAALRVVLLTVPRVSRACEHFPNGFDLHLLRSKETTAGLVPAPNQPQMVLGTGLESPGAQLHAPASRETESWSVHILLKNRSLCGQI